MTKEQSDNSNQYIDKKDFHLLLAESARQAVEQERQRRHDRWFKISSLTLTALTPLMICLATLALTGQQAKNTSKLAERQRLDTLAIADSNIASAKEIATSNIDSAKEIARASQEQTKEIAESNLSMKRLEHLNDIFRGIISNPHPEADNNAIKIQIYSLAAYEDSALVYLINLRNHYENKRLSELVAITDTTIDNILRSGQIDLTEHRFEGEQEDKLNLRERKFIKYNFSNSVFIRVNLYNADLSTSTLKYVFFKNSDLYKTKFNGCNLNDSEFRNCDLRKADFKDAKLRDVTFSKCKLEGAQFAWGSLVKVDILPFSALIAEKIDSHGKTGKEKYLNLLLPYLDKIENMDPEDDDELQTVVNKLEMNFQSLINRLRTLKEKEDKFSRDQHKPSHPARKSELALK